MKLKKVEYKKEEGKLVAYETYDNGDTRKVFINNGMVDYILNGSDTLADKNEGDNNEK